MRVVGFCRATLNIWLGKSLIKIPKRIFLPIESERQLTAYKESIFCNVLNKSAIILLRLDGKKINFYTYTFLGNRLNQNALQDQIEGTKESELN